jgi:hypothetical protein
MLTGSDCQDGPRKIGPISERNRVCGQRRIAFVAAGVARRSTPPAAKRTVVRENPHYSAAHAGGPAAFRPPKRVSRDGSQASKISNLKPSKQRPLMITGPEGTKPNGIHAPGSTRTVPRTEGE